MKFLLKFVMLIAVVVIAGGIYIWSGSYNIGADVPHWALTRHVIGALREHSIEARSKDIRVPALDNPAMIAEGAEHYSQMCTGCHLAPDIQDSELREGLYPRPPNLTRFAPDPAEAFWVIKHGIKMTGMPAWGKTHDDLKIWAMVAYLQKQPQMSIDEYRKLTLHAAATEAAEHAPHDMPAMSGMHTAPAPTSSAAAPASH